MTCKTRLTLAFRNRWQGHQSHAIELLDDVMNLLRQTVPASSLPPAMPMFGTLLGLIRHDELIPWDDDIDLLVFDTDYLWLKSALSSHLQRPEYGHLFLQTHAECGLIRLLYRKPICRHRKAWPFVDLFCAIKNAQGYVIDRQPAHQFTREQTEPFCEHKKWSMRFRWPSQPMGILKQLYGANCLSEACSPRWCHQSHRTIKSYRVPLLEAIGYSAQYHTPISDDKPVKLV